MLFRTLNKRSVRGDGVVAAGVKKPLVMPDFHIDAGSCPSCSISNADPC